MKLFQQLLVAGASLSLIAPIGAQASDLLNLEGMNDYNRSKKSSSKSKRFDSNTFVNEVNEDLATLKGRVDGLEAQQNNLEAGSFSDTTVLTGTATMTLAALENEVGEEEEGVMFQYMYQTVSYTHLRAHETQ